MKARARGFRSFLADDLEAFLAYKRALARRYDNEEASLRLFDRYLADRGVRDLAGITAGTVQDFLASRPRIQPRSYNHLLGVVRRFFDWTVTQERAQHSPVQARPRRTTSRRIPFLFDQEQARCLLEAAAQLPDNPRATRRADIYVTIFALLYGLGLRVGEVARLRCGDVDLARSLLVIRHTKFGKSRLVPFGPRLAHRLSTHLDGCRCRSQSDPDSPVFSFTRGRCLRPETISQTFHHLVARLGIAAPPGVASPSVHCLRHSFAVGTLLRWYRAGLDPAQRLLHLSTFLGHADPASTAVYLTVTADLLMEANSRFERLVSSSREEG